MKNYFLVIAVLALLNCSDPSASEFSLNGDYEISHITIDQRLWSELPECE